MRREVRGWLGTDPTNSLKVGIAGLAATSLTANVVGLGSGICLARALATHGRGEYQLATLYWALVPGTLCLSLSTLIAAQAPDLGSSRGWYTRRGLAFVAIGFLVALALAPLDLMPSRVLLILGLGALGYMVSDLVQGRMRQLGDFRSLARFRLIDMAGSSALIICFFLAGRLSVATATFALVATTAAAVFWSLPRLHLRRDGDVPALAATAIRSVHGATLLRIVTSWSNQLAVVAVLGTSSLGVYAVAGSVAAQFAILPAALGTVGFAAATRDTVDAGRRLERTLRVLISTAALGAIGVWLVGPTFFSAVFGHAFTPAGHVAALLTLNAACEGSLLVMENYLIVRIGPSVALRNRLIGLPSLALSAPIFLVTESLFAAALIPIGMNLSSAVMAGWRLQKVGQLRPLAIVLPGSRSSDAGDEAGPRPSRWRRRDH